MESSSPLAAPDAPLSPSYSPSDLHSHSRLERLAAYFRSREALWAMLLSVLIALAFSTYYWSHAYVMNEADPRLLAEFRGNRPYQLRILIPFLAHWSARLSGWNIVGCYQVLMMSFSVALFFAFGAYLREFTTPRAARWLSLLLVAPLLAIYSHKWFYPYDIPAVFFTTLGLWLLARRHFAPYLLVLALATLNRETSVFLILIFVLTARDPSRPLPRRTFWTVLALQIVLWVLIRGILSKVFAGNPGQALEWHWRDNAATLLAYARIVDFKLGAATAMLIGLLLAGAFTRRFQPAFVRAARGAWWPFLAGMSLVGVIVETRIYGEMIPVLLAPALLGAWNWMQKSQEQKSQERTQARRA